MNRPLRTDFVSIPSATFMMGSSIAEVDACVVYWGTKLADPSYTQQNFRSWIMKEFPQHPVHLSAYEIGRFPVTNGEYQNFIAETGHPSPESIRQDMPASHPVWGVSFEDAMAYAGWLGQHLHRLLRLPTEAEWEYASRGPSRREFPYGENFRATHCNTLEAGIGHTTSVDHYVQGVSEWGIWDMAGNVEEWTMDFYAPYPGGEYIEDELARLLNRQYRVLRGGSFARGGDLARGARRHGAHPSPEFRYTGFRLAAS